WAALAILVIRVDARGIILFITLIVWIIGHVHRQRTPIRGYEENSPPFCAGVAGSSEILGPEVLAQLVKRKPQTIPIVLVLVQAPLGLGVNGRGAIALWCSRIVVIGKALARSGAIAERRRDARAYNGRCLEVGPV